MSVIMEISKQDIDQANSLAASMSMASVPEILMRAMGGKEIPKLLGMKSFTAESSTTGLVLTTDNIIKIKNYVAFGLGLPNTEATIKERLGYPASLSTYAKDLAPNDFMPLFALIAAHCATWSDLEAEIKTLGTSLKIFAEKFVITGEDILKLVADLPVKERIKTLTEKEIIEGRTVPFGPDDTAILIGIIELLEILKKEVGARKNKTGLLLKKIQTFRNTLDNKVHPGIATKKSAIKNVNLSTEQKKLTEAIASLNQEISSLDKEYSKLVGYAFTGASGLILGPIGIVSWAITGGVFGYQAEVCRKERNTKIGERDAKQRELATVNTLLTVVGTMDAYLIDTEKVIEDTEIGIQNLEVVWDSVDAYVGQSLSDLNEIRTAETTDKDGKVVKASSIIGFNTSYTSSVSSWKNVRNITADLLDLFDRARKMAEGV